MKHIIEIIITVMTGTLAASSLDSPIMTEVKYSSYYIDKKLRNSISTDSQHNKNYRHASCYYAPSHLISTADKI